MYLHCSSTTSDGLNALLIDRSLTLLTETELKHLHNVNARLWDLSFQPTPGVTQPFVTIPFHSPGSPSQPTTSPPSWTQQATGITELLNECNKLYGYGFASVSEGETPVSSPLRPLEQVISKGRDKSRLVEDYYAPSVALILAIAPIT
ncbi:uncharacterized protein FPRO_03689 [Fusarium proliferatum ET1]|uniref:Uncharacterized protein n=1 Tax=Fusarium proliferatum (strain ET1) TaxID=1227346 RepID=A0A1L7V585_FUSPR|nr:uncharacterized protein FPRO_03689 [Fusarium proliferatum ET1]CZR36051.1 uncharacterized protein FPRO_03689 [Fusarium proliferatum ET1]